MQLSLRPYVTAGVAVIGAGLIHVTPPAAPDIGQPVVELAAAWDVVDLVDPVDAAVNSLGAGAGPLVDSVAGILTPDAGALSPTVEAALPSPADADIPQFFDPAYWEQWWNLLLTGDPINAWFGLINGLASIPIIGPIFSVVGIVSFLLMLGGILPHPAEADGLATGLQDLHEATLPGDIDPAEPAVATALGDSAGLDDMSALFSGAAGLLEPVVVLEGPSAVLDPGAVLSIIPILELDPELDHVLMSLMP
ncbi:hypothetical protein [Mycolicibacter longobardus]|uniref:hypothetical protein n=1 Tax=Mycolicibacter longobardus TaxID=1108812 RepID=UPI001055570D|nr:hypothetical protein [Mycolicibacter longobardus]MCV7382389.1 hypothetical protein [Mycolicibacter longobardus]